MNKDNNLGRVLALLSLTLLMSFGLYSLPDTLFGYKIKKVDLLSDFKVKEEKLSLDSLKQQLEQADTLQVDSVALRDSIMRSAGIDSAALALRDSLYKAVLCCSRGGFAGGSYRGLFSWTYRFATIFRRLKKQAGIESSGTCGLPWRFFYRRRYYGGRFPFRDAKGIWGAGCWFCTGHIRSGTVPSNRGATCLRMDYLVYADRS